MNKKEGQLYTIVIKKNVEEKEKILGMEKLV